MWVTSSVLPHPLMPNWLGTRIHFNTFTCILTIYPNCAGANSLLTVTTKMKIQLSRNSKIGAENF